jgi:hypothetical protein
MTNSSTILYELECAHAAPGVPTLVNGTLQCVWCQNAQPIVGVILYEWKFTCLDCPAARWTGLSKHNAELFGTRHLRRFPTHRFICEYTRNPLAVRTQERMNSWNERKDLRS